MPGVMRSFGKFFQKDKDRSRRQTVPNDSDASGRASAGATQQSTTGTVRSASPGSEQISSRSKHTGKMDGSKSSTGAAYEPCEFYLFCGTEKTEDFVPRASDVDDIDYSSLRLSLKQQYPVFFTPSSSEPNLRSSVIATDPEEYDI